MSADPALIPARLDELHHVHDEIRRFEASVVVLRTVDQARADYDRHLADLLAARDALRRRKDELDAAWRRRSWRVEAIDPPRQAPAVGPLPERRRGRPAVRPEPAAPPTMSRPADRRARRRLKTLVNRWRRTLEPDVLGQVNQINDDPSRPLGEALMLLPDTVLLKNPNHDHESEADQLTRLSDWVAALQDYRETRRKELDAMELEYRGLLGIWGLWSARDHDAAGRDAWDTFLAKTRRELAEEIAQLEHEVNDLTARSGTAGAPP